MGVYGCLRLFQSFSVSRRAGAPNGRPYILRGGLRVITIVPIVVGVAEGGRPERAPLHFAERFAVFYDCSNRFRCRGGRAPRTGTPTFCGTICGRWMRLFLNRFRCHGVRAPRTGAPTFCGAVCGRWIRLILNRFRCRGRRAPRTGAPTFCGAVCGRWGGRTGGRT